ncbi:MAG TPA: histidine--tRNA ligase [Candidatus Latescibacteria bacterium]|nr:histidine--tRNA ligase [Candidatus Latescibacterota bacterium]
MKYRAPRGTHDRLPDEMSLWYHLEGVVREQMRLYNYSEIATPTFEGTELFSRSIGEETEIVEKQMYTFFDKAGRSLTLRPEGTPPVVRSYIEHSLGRRQPLQKFFYIGPMYRQEAPQAGRLRQFHQFGAEAIGAIDPAMDVEMISLLLSICRRLGLKAIALHLGSVGCPRCRPLHREKLLAFLGGSYSLLCPDCQKRYHRNPLRILDCKRERCRELTEDAPSVIDFLCEDCALHFEGVKHHLQQLEIAYTLDRRLVRGLDYYTRTAFEVISANLGAQNAIGGGGRYDELIKELGGDPTPAVGFAAGMERILLAMEKEGCQIAQPPTIGVYVAPVGDRARAFALSLLKDLRQAGISCDGDYLKRSLKAQMRMADRMGASYTVILGEEEMDRNRVLVRGMRESKQEEVGLDRLVGYLIEKLGVRRQGQTV